MTGVRIALIGNQAENGGAGGFSCTIDPMRATSINKTSPPVTATVVGGTPAYTYSWTSNKSLIFPDTPDASSTTFSTYSGDQVIVASGKCTVQDSTGLIVDSNNVFIILNNGGEGTKV